MSTLTAAPPIPVSDRSDFYIDERIQQECLDDACQWLDNGDDVLARIDEAMELIARATAAAAGTAPITTYDISVIVPVYNERDLVPQVIQRLQDVMPTSTEIIVVDDASDDGTGDYLRGLIPGDRLRILHRRRNHGKGSAVRLGIRHSRGRVVAIQDADLEYDPADLLRVIWPVLEGRVDAAYGSRYLDNRNGDRWWHALGNRLLTTLSNTLTGLSLTDMETCHKAFRGDFLRSIPLRECRFGFEPEITAKIAARDAIVVEVPTRYTARGYAEGKKISFRDAIAAVACIWRYRK